MCAAFCIVQNYLVGRAFSKVRGTQNEVDVVDDLVVIDDNAIFLVALRIHIFSFSSHKNKKVEKRKKNKQTQTLIKNQDIILWM
jgi:hypothetical protein